MDNLSLETRIYDLLDDGTLLLKSRLERIKAPIRHTSDDDELDAYVTLAITMLSFACYSVAETMRVLVRAKVTLQIPTLVRTAFESSIRATYIVSVNRMKAKDFILLDSFEKFDLPREADLSFETKNAIEAECRATLALFPDLVERLSDGAEIVAGKMPIDNKVLRSIRDKLDFPKVRAMMKELEKKHPGFHGDLYTIAFRFGSLTVHPNIISLRRIFDAYDGENMTSPSLDLREPGAPDFTLQALNSIIGMGFLLDEAFAASTEEKAEWRAISDRQAQLRDELKSPKK